jgi:hypothetical protein
MAWCSVKEKAQGQLYLLPLPFVNFVSRRKGRKNTKSLKEKVKSEQRKLRSCELQDQLFVK